MNPGNAAALVCDNDALNSVTADRFRELRRLFDAALTEPPHRRADWLASACPDAELRARVEALLEADAVTGSALPMRPFILIPGGADGASATLEGRRIGDYTLTREIGRGGMGVVYLATRVDGLFSRPVAVKIVRADAVDPVYRNASAAFPGDHVRRFQQERDIVARLDHPNIARLLDGGTTEDGLHYSVIEYVDGQRIDEYSPRASTGGRRAAALLRPSVQQSSTPISISSFIAT